MNKQQLEDNLANGAICENCAYCDHCGEIGEDCLALTFLKGLTDYPSFDHSQINDNNETRPQQ